jgi:hypothetical protein
VLSQPTVFVIGAGAGVDIGMPTGAKLIEEMISKLDYRFEGGALKKGGSEILEALQIAGKRKSINLDELIKAGRSIAQGVSYVQMVTLDYR